MKLVLNLNLQQINDLSECLLAHEFMIADDRDTYGALYPIFVALHDRDPMLFSEDDLARNMVPAEIWKK